MQNPVNLKIKGWLEPPYFQMMQQVTRLISIQDARALQWEPGAYLGIISKNPALLRCLHKQ